MRPESNGVESPNSEECMKKFLLVLGLAAGLTTAASAQSFEAGVSAMLRFPFAVSDELSAFEGVGIEDFKFGADIGVVLGPIQINSIIDFRPGNTVAGYTVPGGIEALITGGILFDLAILRIGAAVGPTMIFDFPPPGGPADPQFQEGAGPLGLGLGVRANVDLALGPVVIRLNAISGFDFLRMAAASNSLQYMDLKIGLSALFRFQ